MTINNNFRALCPCLLATSAFLCPLGSSFPLIKIIHWARERWTWPSAANPLENISSISLKFLGSTGQMTFECWTCLCKTTKCALL